MSLRHIIGETLHGLRANASVVVSVVLVSLVSTFFLGSGLLAQRQIDRAQGYWYDRVQVSMFLCTDASTDVPSCAAGAVTDAQREQIRADLESMRPLVAEIHHETREEAYRHFTEQVGDDAMVRSVPVDAMPESFRVRLSDPGRFEVVSSAFTGAPGVESVEDQREILAPFFSFLSALSLAALALAGLLGLCAVLLVSTMIRQSAFMRRRETGIKRLVGASAATLQLPFILETLLATMLGAVMATGALWALVEYGVRGWLSGLLARSGASFVGLVGVSDVAAVAPWLVGGSVVLPAVVAWLTLRRHVRV